jgi:hypothetical protein
MNAAKLWALIRGLSSRAPEYRFHAAWELVED